MAVEHMPQTRAIDGPSQPKCTCPESKPQKWEWLSLRLKDDSPGGFASHPHDRGLGALLSEKGWLASTWKRALSPLTLHWALPFWPLHATEPAGRGGVPSRGGVLGTWGNSVTSAQWQLGG